MGFAWLDAGETWVEWCEINGERACGEEWGR